MMGGFKAHMESKCMLTVSHINEYLHLLLSISVSSAPGILEGIQLVPYWCWLDATQKPSFYS